MFFCCCSFDKRVKIVDMEMDFQLLLCIMSGNLRSETRDPNLRMKFFLDFLSFPRKMTAQHSVLSRTAFIFSSII